MVIIIPIVVIIAIYFSAKRLANNSSSKGLSYTPRKQSKETEGGSGREKLTLTTPPFPGKEEKALDRDSNVDPHPLFSDYLISYCDSKGATTERRITILDIDSQMIQAYCHLRHDRRTFYVSRVYQWINCDTGEVISDIFKDLGDAIKNSVYGTVLRMREDLYPVMGVLFYLCKGDNRIMANERKVLVEIFYSLCEDPRLTDTIINDGISKYHFHQEQNTKN